jgi:hypothetical protein
MSPLSGVVNTRHGFVRFDDLPMAEEVTEEPKSASKGEEVEPIEGPSKSKMKVQLVEEGGNANKQNMVFESDSDSEDSDSEAAAKPAAPAPQDSMAFRPRTWVSDIVDELPPITTRLLLLAVPFFGIGYDSYLGNEIDEKGKKQQFEKVEISNIIKEKNELKRSSMVALGINALIFAGLTCLFPITYPWLIIGGSIIATGYLFLVAKNFVQFRENKVLVEDLKLDKVIAPVPEGKHVPKDKTEFYWHKLVE